MRLLTMMKTMLCATGITLGAITMPASSASFEEVLEGAKKEGKLFVLVSSPGKPETHQALAKAFNERFGLSIQVEWTATNPVQTGSKLIAEQGGAGFVDVIGAGGNQEMAVLVERGILKPWPWADVFSDELPEISAAIDPVIDDLKGTGLLIAHNIYGMAWNKDLIADEDVPDSYADLLKPEWAGRFAVNAFSLNPVDYYSFVLGEDETLQMARDILENQPVLERGTGAVTRAISVGQAEVGISSFHQAGRVDNLGFKMFSDYVPIGVLHVYVPETAPNPNAARLFTAWFATEGMKIVNEHEPMPRLGDGSSADAMLAAVEKGGGKVIGEMSLADTNSAAEMRNRISEIMTE
ncbi:extracellular solute-binding protein [Chelativorans sp. Marseille-P2723]|uniref:ABC transporter substrate-binding protein n=1 Tax=Chelativorans sp. Marseille-P2723 TaxID=2709133 RepID=UPI0015703CD8|nr:extracellular solute-binding protein [Chelativorans sp. Marseille-P2723]